MPKLKVLEGPLKDQIFEFDEDIVFIGRSSRNDIQLEDSKISRKHLKIFRLEALLFVEDLKSTNGTFINGQAIKPGEGIQVGVEDIISLGNSTIRLDATTEVDVGSK